MQHIIRTPKQFNTRIWGLTCSTKQFNTRIWGLTCSKEDIGDNLYLLAKIIHLEERTQNPKNIDRKVAVGRVVLNRVKHPDFPDTIEEVIFQENQFSPTFDGSWDEYEPTELDFEAALLALKEVQIVGEKGKDVGEAYSL